MAIKKNTKASGQSDTCRSYQGNGEAEGGYVHARPFATLFEMRFLVVKNNVEKLSVNLQIITAVIVNEPQFPKPVHEKAHPRASCAYHLCEGLLTDIGD